MTVLLLCLKIHDNKWYTIPDSPKASKKTNHQYFYWAQDFFISEGDFCNFVVWMERDIVIDRIMLYYGAPILKGILDKDRFLHYLYFVNSILILLKDSCSETEIATADLMLIDFVRQVSSLYGISFMTLNLYQLLHLVVSRINNSTAYGTDAWLTATFVCQIDFLSTQS